VTITDSTTGATIYYTSNGNPPTTSSTMYSVAIPVSSTETIEAIAVAAGYTNSVVASGTYTINLAAAASPVFSPTAATYTSTQSVTIADSTTGATIYYTTNGNHANHFIHLIQRRNHRLDDGDHRSHRRSLRLLQQRGSFGYLYHHSHAASRHTRLLAGCR